MSTSSQLIVVVVCLLAALDWFAVVSSNGRLERVAKPLVMVALLVVGLVSDLTGWSLVWLVIALVAGLLGDIFLLPTVDRFIPGLAAFLVGHLAYAALAVVLGTTTSFLAAGLILSSLAVLTVGTKITDAVQGTAMFAPVVAYVVVIGASTALLIATGRWLMVIGAVLFAVSDSLLGWGRFIAPAWGGRVAVHATYHLGQLLIVLGAVAG